MLARILGKGKPSFASRGIASCCSHSGNKKCGEILKKLKINEPPNPAMPLPGVRPRTWLLLHRYVLSRAHCWAVPALGVSTTWISFAQWMDKENGMWTQPNTIHPCHRWMNKWRKEGMKEIYRQMYRIECILLREAIQTNAACPVLLLDPTSKSLDVNIYILEYP